MLLILSFQREGEEESSIYLLMERQAVVIFSFLFTWLEKFCLMEFCTWIRTEFFVVSHFSKRNTKAKCHSNWIFLFISFSDWCQYGKPSDNSFFVTVLGLNEVEDKPDTERILKMVISPTVLSKNCLWINLYASHIVHYRKIICFLMLMLKLTMVFIKDGHHSELFVVSSYCRSSCLEIILCLCFSRKSIWKNII